MKNTDTSHAVSSNKSSSLTKALLVSITLLSSNLLVTGCSTFGGKDKEIRRTQPSATEQVYYEQAQKNIDRKRYKEAEKSLDDIRTFYPVGKYSKQALLDLMYVKFQQKDFTAATIAADRFIKSYPNHPNVDYAWYTKGVAEMSGGYNGLIKYTNLNQSHRDVSYLRPAFVDFDNLIKRFPNSKYTPDAIKRMYFIYNQFAENEINAARFNVKRKAYLGAIERAKTVFLGFPQSPQTPEAIATLAYSYDKLGLTDKSAKYKKLLSLNYPHLLSGDTVLLAKSRASASLLNKLTLGLAGRPAGSGTAVYVPKQEQ